MKLLYPSYYEDFVCIADKCKKSCCEGWALEIDNETYQYYQSIPGPFGNRIREVISSGDFINNDDEDETASRVFALEVDGRCPFLEDCGLCTIVKELGPEALCSICATYPRSSFTYGDTTELFFTLSCEEACRLHFLSDKPFTYEEREESDAEENCDSYEDEVFEETLSDYPKIRQEMIDIILDEKLSISDKIDKLSDIVAKIQLIDKNSITNALFVTKIRERIHLLQGLEPIDPDWDILLTKLCKSAAENTHNDSLEAFDSLTDPVYNLYLSRILLYFVTRYMPGAYYDLDLKSKLMFAYFCLLSIKDLFAIHLNEHRALTETDMQLIISSFSRQVEHSEENLDYLFEELVFA